MTDCFEAPEGGCACGQIRYRLSCEPMFVHCCHCKSCQRETGSAFAVNAIIETDRVVLLSGKPETVLTPSDSGKGQKIVRCPTCHVAVWSHYAGPDDKVSFVRAGTLDNPGRTPPDIHIFTDSKQPWVLLPSDTPSAAIYYDRQDHWSQDSLKRRKAVGW